MKTENLIIPKKPVTGKVKGWLIFVAVTLVFVWAFSGVPLAGVKDTAWEITKSILAGLFQPDWDYVYDPEGEDLLRKLLETLSIAFFGTFISAVLCIPFSFWAASNLSQSKFVSGSGKFMLSFIRTFPEIVMALLFIKAVGPGAFAGVLALGLHSIGMMGKLNAETIENIEMGPSEALMASGANKIKTLLFAVVPQVLPHFLSYTLYRFEINVRSAAILGVIGAGGIGTPLIFAIQTRDWDKVGIILLGIIIMVTVIDLISGVIRKKLV